jgi:hypothetical protein
MYTGRELEAVIEAQIDMRQDDYFYSGWEYDDEDSFEGCEYDSMCEGDEDCHYDGEVDCEGLLIIEG